MELNIEHRLTEVEDRSKSNTKRLDSVEKRQDDLDKLVSSVAVMAQEQEHIKDDVSEIKTDIKTLTEKPGKRWDELVEKGLSVVIAAIVGYILAHFGL